MKTFDAIIIGTGQSGPSLAARLATAGLSVAVVERHKFGGTCVNNGCIPTKAMVATAYAVHLARRANDFGFVVDGGIRVDMKQVKSRKDAISGRSRVGVENWMRGLKNCTTYTGHARFRSAHEVEVGDEVLKADKIFLNVGGRALTPEIPGLDRVPSLNNSSMMDVDFLPSHLVILGGSYIGLEFGQMFRRFGSRVTIIEMGPRLVQHEDEDTSAAILDIMKQESIDVRLNANCLGVSGGPGNITVRVECADGGPVVTGSHLLLAVGRKPNTDDLGLDAAGVARDKRGYVVVDDQLQTNVPGIWALGDCNGKGAFTHTSYNDFEIVAANLLDGASRRVSDRIMAYALFIDPPLGRAGLTEAEAVRKGHSVLVGKRAMERVSRAFEKSETNGFMKIVVDGKSKEILGAAFLGTGGDEAVHVILDAMYAKAPYTVLQRAMHIHPTVSEYIPTLLGELAPSAMVVRT